MRRPIIIPLMVIALVIVLSPVVAGQPRSLDGTVFEQDPLYPKATPLLQVKSVKYKGIVVEFGRNIDDPDWLTEAEFDVQNNSPFTVNGAVLAARILGTSQTLTLVRWNCAENSCDELTSEEKPIPPGAVVTFKSQVKAKTLQDL